MKNILIIKLSAIGDVIHALPVAAAIKKTWPDCHLTWVVSPIAADIVRNSPAIDNIIIFDRKKLNSLSSFIKYIRPFSHQLNVRHYDVSIDLQGLLKSALVAFLAHADKKIGYADMREGSFLISSPVKGSHQRGHIIDRYLDTAATLGCAVEDVVFPLGITLSEKNKALSLLSENGLTVESRYIVFIIGANWPNKRWPTAYFSQLAEWCKNHRLTPILAGAGETDKVSAVQIKSSASDIDIIDMVGKTSLKELAYILQNAVAAVGGDTGSMHMAAALNCPAVMVMGPTDANRNGPYRQPENAIEVGYPCRHCWKRKCRFQRDCLAAIKPSRVITKLENILEGGCHSTILCPESTK